MQNGTAKVKVVIVAKHFNEMLRNVMSRDDQPHVLVKYYKFVKDP